MAVGCLLFAGIALAVIGAIAGVGAAVWFYVSGDILRAIFWLLVGFGSAKMYQVLAAELAD
jgi:ABC-type cobalamin transport system permease subunit